MKDIFLKKIMPYIGLCLFFLLPACDLDYENTEVINPDNVWKDKKMINAYFNDIQGSMLPGWPYNANDSDEGMKGAGSMSDYQRGIIDVEKTGQKFDYDKIDKINFLLDKLEGIPKSVLTAEENKQLAGQALFWRAWDYWGKVTTFGGVPLILKPQDVTDRESLFVPRNKTSECVAQIIKDLDDAISFLPDQWTDDDYGRIDKGIAMAFKGKVLMWYASPLFNSNNDKKRWETAYEANKAAVDFLTGVGKGLYPNYKNIWYDERNMEVVMVNQFYYPDHTFNQAAIRPYPFGEAGANFPYVPLLLAYPKKDGSALELDIDRLPDPAYNSDFMTDFYTNRDDRFYASIFCGGTIYPIPEMKAGERFWYVWEKLEEDLSVPGVSRYSNLNFVQNNGGIGDCITGFTQLKGFDESLEMSLLGNAETDWIEIRFAEVLMNYGECANEVGRSNEALQVLYDIRKRAGIESGNGRYGITAASQGEIREAYIKERFVEFAFEGKRWGDLRRWKRFDILNKLGYRSGLYLVINNNGDIEGFDWTRDISDPEVRKMFHMEYIRNLDAKEEYKFNLDVNHWFYPINKEGIDRNSKLEQNNEWGGTFDPLL